jgi:hypothetical protein
MTWSVKRPFEPDDCAILSELEFISSNPTFVRTENPVVRRAD